MRLEQLVRPFIPVNSFTQERVEVIPVERPEVGIRWGRPSRFEFSIAGAQGKSGPTTNPRGDDDELEEEEEIIDFTGESTVYFVEDESQPNLGGFLRMTSQIEFTGIRKVERYDSQGRRQLPGDVETVIVFKFTLNADQVES